MSTAALPTTPAIFWTPEPDFDKDDPTYVFHHESGRTFSLSVMEHWDEACGPQETFFVYEDVPSDCLMVYNRQGQVIDREESETLKALRQDPHRFFASLAEHGIDPERVMLHGAGRGPGAITYTTREAANQAVWKALQDNVWYEHHSPALARQIQRDRRCQEQERRASRRFHESNIESLQTALAHQTALLRGTGPWIPSSISEQAIREALLSFRNAPSLATWTTLSRCMILPNGKTAWQVWTDHDATAPRRLESGAFTRHPDPDDFFRWIPLSAERAIAFHREKLAAL